MAWLAHFLGVDDVSGRFYAFWSGFGSDLGYFSVFAVLYRKHNCHQRGCWRLGHHLTGVYTYCRKHHEANRDGG